MDINKRMLIVVSVFLFLLTMVNAATVSENLSTGLDLYYAFENENGDIYDLTGSGDDGTISGSPTRGVTGFINNAFDYNGTGNVSKLPKNVDMNADWSISFWFKLYDYGASYSLVKQRDEDNNDPWLDITMNNGPNIITSSIRDTDKDRCYGDANADTYNSRSWNTNEWYHYVLVYDHSEKNYTTYINNTLYTNDICPGYDQSGSRSYDDYLSLMGQTVSWQGDDANSVNGIMDEFGLWTRPLTGSEVEILFNNGDGIIYESWNYTMSINNLTGEYPTLNISYESGMNSDFSDLRFFNNSVELNYTIRKKSNSEWAFVTIDVNNKSSIIMYYGNSNAVSTSNANDVFNNPIANYFMDQLDASDELIDVGGDNQDNLTFEPNASFTGDGYIGKAMNTSYIPGEKTKNTGAATISLSNDFPANTENDYTYSIWTYLYTNTGGDRPYIWRGEDGTRTVVALASNNNDDYISLGYADDQSFNEDVILNKWVHLTYTYRESNNSVNLYINGSHIANAQHGGDLIPDDNYLDIFHGDGRWSGGVADEAIIYDRILSTKEIEDIYSMSEQTDTALLNITIDTPPTAVLNSPANETAYAGSQSVDFQCKGYDDANLENLTFKLWNNSIYYKGLNTSFLTDLLSYYEFQQTSGDVIDSDGTYDGTNNGPTRGGTGIIDNAFDFDGIDDQVEIPYSSDWDIRYNDNMTWSIWVNLDTYGGANPQHIFRDLYNDDMAGAHLSFNGSGYLYIRFRDGDSYEYTHTANGTNIDKFQLNQWYHIATTFNRDTSELDVYINGSHKYTIPPSGRGGFAQRNNDMHIGSTPGNTYYLDGTLDEFATWTRVLNSTEIESLYNSGDGVKYSSSVNNSFIYSETNTDGENDTLENFTYTVSGGINYTWNCLATDDNSQSAYAVDNWTISTTKVDAPPLFTIPTPSNDTVNLGIDWEGVDFELINEDNISVDTWFVNDTNFTINSTGYLDNNTVLSIGMYPINVSVNNSDSQTNSTIFTLNVSDTLGPSLSNLSWITTGGFTDTTLTYQQQMDYINVTSSDLSTPINVYLTVYNPSDTKIIDNQSMSNYTDDDYSYDTSFILNSAGEWSFNITSIDSLGNINTTSQSIDVLKQTQVLTDGWYGYTNNTILNSTEIDNLAIYGYDIFEFTINSSNIDSNWETLKTSINKSRDNNIKTGINIRLDYNYTNSTAENNLLNSISTNFSDLAGIPYTDAMVYISFELVNEGSYTDNQKTLTLNTLSEETVLAISNEYVLFSKNYNHTDLDNAYISYTELLYPSPQTLTEFINTELAYFRNSTSLNRIYDSIPDDVKYQAYVFYDNVVNDLRSTPEGVELSNPFTANLSNGDLLVFNNQSSQNKTVDVSSDLSSTGKDAWDYSNKYLVEENTDLNFSVEIGSYNSTVIIFEDIDHIQMDGLNNSDIYKGASFNKSHFNWTDGVSDGSWNIDGANDIQIELFDPHYIRNSYIVYYGWLNVSYIKSPEAWENYEIVILSDANDAELDLLNYDVTDFYAYISVADYNNSQVWTDAKKSEADTWLALNGSLNLFVDGLDTGIGGTNFSSRMKDLIDYIQIDKNRKAILNTYTAYSEFATWGEGGVMKESCVNRWNGLSASNVDNYTRENWTLELEKADWYKNHDVDVYCMAFDNRTIDGTEQIKNYTELKNIYFASKILGYNDFYLSQPDFQYAHTQYVYDTGKSLDRSYQQLDSDPNTYYRTYEEGIIYYNTTSEEGWINDGRTVNNTQICLNVYDTSDTTENGIEITVNNRQSTGSNEEYTIDDSAMAAGVWNYKCIDVTDEPTNGKYLIEAWYGDHTATAGQGFALAYSDVSDIGKHSWYDTSATDTFFIYNEGRNWMINLTTNESKKASIDKTGRITQSELKDGDNYYFNLSSEISFPIEVWSNPLTYEIIDFDSFKFKNSTGYWVNVSTKNTTSCDSNSPSFSSSVIESETYKSCYEQNGTHTIFRVSAGSLSTREFKILGDTEAPIIISPEDDNITYGDDWAGVDFNATDSLPINWSINDTNFQINFTGYLDDNLTLPADTYAIQVSVNDTEGNTNSTIYTLTVDKATNSFTLDITNSTYPTNGAINASETNTGDGDLTYNLFLDGANVGSGSDVDHSVDTAGIYTVVYNTTGGANYTSGSVTKILNVSKSTTSLTLDITNSTYPTNGIINASETNPGDYDLIYNLFVNGVNVSNGSDEDYSVSGGAGTYTIVYNTTGGTNYIGASVTETLNIEKAAANRTSYSFEGLATYNNSDGDYSVNNIRSLAVTSDGNYLVTSSEGNDTVSIMNITNKSDIVELATYNDSDGDYSIDKISSLAITSDDNYLITSSPLDSYVSIMDITNKSEIVELATYNDSDGDYSVNNIRSLAITSDGNYLVTSSEENDTVSIMNITNKSEIVELATYNNSNSYYSIDSIRSLAITSDDNYLITSSSTDEFVSIMNITNKSEIVELVSYNNTGNYFIDQLQSLAVTSDGNYLITSSSSIGYVSIMNITNKSKIIASANYTETIGEYSIENIRSLSVSSDGNYLATSSYDDHTVSIMDITNKSKIVKLVTYNNSDYSIDKVESIAFFSDGDYLATSSYNNDTVSIMEFGKTFFMTLNITNSTSLGIINASETNTGDSDLTYNLFLDGANVGSGSDIDHSVGSSGTYTVVYNTTGGANYTGGLIERLLSVTESPPTVVLDSPANETNYTASQSVDFQCKGQDDINLDNLTFKLWESTQSYDWWNSSWDYKKEINIEDTAGTMLTNYTIPLNITYNVNMQTDFDDLRFVYDSDEYKYWIEEKSNSSWAYVWVKLPILTANDNSTFYMYYGNENVTTTSDNSTAWAFFDDFDDGSTNGWNVTDGSTIDESGGYMWLNYSGGCSGAQAYPSTNTNFHNGVRTVSRWASLTPNEDSFWGIDNWSDRDTRNARPIYWRRWASVNDHEIHYNYNLIYSTDNAIDPDTMAKLEMAYSPNNFYAKTNSVVMYNNTTGTFESGLTDLIVKFNSDQSGCDSSKIKIDYVYASNYTYPEPISYIGQEDNVNVNINNSLIYNETNTDGQNDTLETFTYTVSEGTNYTWNCLATDNSSQSAYADNNWTIYVYADTYPNISIGNGSPTDNGNYTSSTLTFNASNIYDNYNVSNASLVVNTTIYNTTYNPANNSNVQWTNTFDDGYYEWYFIVYDNINQSTTTETRSFSIDTTYPEVNITAPANGTVVTEFNQSLDLNWTATDVNLDSCWYKFIYEGNGGCYQETANTTSGCGYDTGGYSNLAIEGRDGNFSTYTTIANDEVAYINYTVPVGVTSAKWRVKASLINDNYTIDTSDLEILQLRAKVITCGGICTFTIKLMVEYYNGTSWITLDTEDEANSFYEEAVYWDNVSGTEVTCTDNTTTINYPTTNPDQVTYYFYANDTFGLESTDNTTIYKSTTEPNIGVNLSIGLDPIYNATQEFNITWNITGNTLDNCWYNTSSNGTYTEESLTFVNCSQEWQNFTYPGSDADNYTITFTVNDTLGNENSTTNTVYANTQEAQVNITESSSTTTVVNASQNVSFVYSIGIPQANKSCYFNWNNNGTNWNTECNSFNWTYYPGASPQANLTICTNDEFNNTNCTIMTVYANSNSPFINLTYPVDGQSIYNETYYVNWSINDSIEYGNCYIEYGITGSLTNKTVFCNNTNTTLLYDSNEDYQLIAVYANDSLGNLARSSQVNVTKSSNETIVNITEPFGVLTGLYEPGLTINLSYTFNPAEGVSLEDCWYYYNGSNSSITCTNGTQTITPDIGDEDIQVCAKDTLNNTGCDENSWEYQAVLIFNGTNKDSFTEGELMNFTAILYSQTGFTAEFIFNGTTYSPSINSNGNYYNLTLTSYAPSVNLDPEIVQYKWTMNIGANTYNTSEWNVSIYNISYGDVCNGTYPNLLMNITGIFDESTRQRIEPNVENVSVGIDVDIYTADKSSKVLEIRNFVTDFHHKAICTDLNFSLNYIVESNINYYGNSTYSSKRIWYMTDGILPLNGRNLTEISQQNVSLYLLDPDAVAETPQDFIFRYYNDNNQLESDAIIHVYRKDIGTEYGVTEIGRSGSDDGGNYPIDLSPDTEVYRQIVTIDGEVVYDTNKYAVLTCAQYENFYCVIDLGVGKRSSSSLDTDWYEIDGGQYEITKDYNNRKLTVDFVLEEKDKFNTTTLVVFSPSYNGSLQEIVRDSIQGSTGSITVTVPAIAGGNYTSGQDYYEYYVYKESDAVVYGTVNFANRAYEMFGDEFSLFLALLIVMSLGLMAASGGTLQIVFLVLGLIFVNILGLVRFDVEGTGMGVIIYFIAAGGIMIWKLAAKN